MTEKDDIKESISNALKACTSGDHLDIQSGRVHVVGEVEAASGLGIRLKELKVEVDGPVAQPVDAAQRASEMPYLGEGLVVTEAEDHRAVIRTRPQDVEDQTFHEIDITPGQAVVRRHKATVDMPTIPIELTPDQAGRTVRALARALVKFDDNDV